MGRACRLDARAFPLAGYGDRDTVRRHSVDGGANAFCFQRRSRYLLGCGTLIAMTTATPFVTFLVLGNSEGNPAAQPIWRMAPASVWQQALPWFVMAWVGGVAVSSARLIAGLRMTSRLRRVEIAAPPQEMAAHAGPNDRARPCLTAGASADIVAGRRADRGGLAAAGNPDASLRAMTGLQPAHLEALLAHELAHIRRHDYLVNLLQTVAEAVLFYHPAVWWVSDQIRTERELCCDDLAVEACGDVLIYASALADLDSRRPMRGEMALAANGGSLLNRIRRLAGKPGAGGRQ